MTLMENAKKLRSGSLAENVRTIGYALLIALFIRAFRFQPFFIPTSRCSRCRPTTGPISSSGS